MINMYNCTEAYQRIFQTSMKSAHNECAHKWSLLKAHFELNIWVFSWKTNFYGVQKHSNGYKISLHSKYTKYKMQVKRNKQSKNTIESIGSNEWFKFSCVFSFVCFILLLPCLLLSCCFIIKMNGLCNVYLDKNRSEQAIR